ncbi:putative reverse transcriptase domain-containing protein [Tanacetum coccineum]
MARRPLHWKVDQDVNHKKFSNDDVIMVEDDHDVIHDNNSFDLTLYTNLNDLDFATLNVDCQSTEVEAPPDIIAFDDDDDFIDGEDEVPHDLADFNDEVLASDDDDDVVAIIMSATLARGHGGDGGGDDPSCPHPHLIDIGRKNNHRKKTSIDTGTSLISKSYGTLNDATPRVDVAKEVVSPSMIDDTVKKEKLSPVVTTTESYPPLPTHVTTSAGNAPGKSSYANVTGKPSGKKLNFHTLFTPGVMGLMWLSRWSLSGKYGLVRSMFSLSTRLFSFQFSSMDWLDAMLENVWVKLHGVPVTAFSEDGLSAIATKLGTPLMLDSYTADMCMQSWGRSSYARAMIKLRADVELKDNIVAAMPKITREGCRISKIITQ